MLCLTLYSFLHDTRDNLFEYYVYICRRFSTCFCEVHLYYYIYVPFFRLQIFMLIKSSLPAWNRDLVCYRPTTSVRWMCRSSPKLYLASLEYVRMFVHQWYRKRKVYLVLLWNTGWGWSYTFLDQLYPKLGIN